MARILILPDIRLFSASGIRPDIRQVKSGIRPDTGYKKAGLSGVRRENRTAECVFPLLKVQKECPLIAHAFKKCSIFQGL
jgi:hypothetical protein